MSAIRVRSRRSPASGAAVIVHGDGVMACAVLDLSSSGARLKLTGPAPTPEQFELRIAASGAAHRCHVVWRAREEVGVRFLT